MYLVYYSSGNIDIMSTEGFLKPSKQKGLLQHTVDNKVSVLARLTFYENLFIEEESSFRCPQ